MPTIRYFNACCWRFHIHKLYYNLFENSFLLLTKATSMSYNKKDNNVALRKELAYERLCITKMAI